MNRACPSMGLLYTRKVLELGAAAGFVIGHGLKVRPLEGGWGLLGGCWGGLGHELRASLTALYRKHSLGCEAPDALAAHFQLIPRTSG